MFECGKAAERPKLIATCNRFSGLVRLAARMQGRSEEGTNMKAMKHGFRGSIPRTGMEENYEV